VGENIRKAARPHDGQPGAVRRAIEVAVEEELTAALCAAHYARDVGRSDYRNGHRSRTVSGPTGPLALTLPRATLFTAMDAREWTSALVPRYRWAHGRSKRLPAIYPALEYVRDQGLIAYAADQRQNIRRAAHFVDRILRGARPADLPVERTTTFNLVINLKADKALGLTIQPAVLARADEVIE
jgi:hypothetical protein